MIKIECQTTGGTPSYSTGEIATCELDTGLVCNNVDNDPIPCSDYQVRYECKCLDKPTAYPPGYTGQTPTAYPPGYTGVIPTAYPPGYTGVKPTAYPNFGYTGISIFLISLLFFQTIISLAGK